jgi:hypothetical protein
MPIFQSIGLAVLIIVLKFLVPAIWSELEATVIAFLHGARISADIASGIAASAGSAHVGSIPLSALPHAPLPRP